MQFCLLFDFLFNYLHVLQVRERERDFIFQEQLNVKFVSQLLVECWENIKIHMKEQLVSVCMEKVEEIRVAEVKYYVSTG